MDALALNPTSTVNGKRLRVYYATQVAIQPPTFVVFVNDPELMHFSYERFLENQIRKSFDFTGTPILAASAWIRLSARTLNPMTWPSQAAAS